MSINPTNSILNGNQLSVLQGLQKTSSSLATSQQQLASGQKVNSPTDNASAYFTASSLMQQVAGLNARNDQIGQGIQTVNAMNNGVAGVQSLLSTMQGLLSQASSALGQPNSNQTLNSIASSYNSLVKQINGIASDSGYGGVNLMQAGTQMTLPTNTDNTTNITLNGFDGTAQGLGIPGAPATPGGTGTLTASDINSQSGVASVQQALNSASSQLQAQSTNMAASLASMGIQQTYMTNQSNINQTGAGNLTSADMATAAISELASNTQQQLGVVTMGLTTQNARSILSLFG